MHKKRERKNMLPKLTEDFLQFTHICAIRKLIILSHSLVTLYEENEYRHILTFCNIAK